MYKYALDTMANVERYHFHSLEQWLRLKKETYSTDWIVSTRRVKATDTLHVNL